MVLVADHGWSYFAAVPGRGDVVLRRRPAHRPAGVAHQRLLPGDRDAGDGLRLPRPSSCGSTRSPAARTARAPVRGTASLIPPSWLPVRRRRPLAREPLWMFCLLVVIAAVMFLLARNGIRSRPGRALVAMRDNEASATASGIDVMRYKAVAFAVSAAYGGIAGAMLMMNRPFASDVQFGDPGRDLPRGRRRHRRRRHDRRRRPGRHRVRLRAVLRLRVGDRLRRPAARRQGDHQAVVRLAAAGGQRGSRHLLRAAAPAPGVPAARGARRRPAPPAGTRDHHRAEPAVDGRRQPASCRRDAAGSAQPHHWRAPASSRRYTT